MDQENEDDPALCREINTETNRLLLGFVDNELEIFEVYLSPIQAIPTLDVSLQDDSEPSSSKNVDVEEIIIAGQENDKGENSIDRKFGRDTHRKYSLQERTALGQLCQRCKNQYEKQMTNDRNKVTFNSKKRKHTEIKTKEGWVSRAVREFCPDFKNLKNDDPIFRKAKAMAERCPKMIQLTDKEPNLIQTNFGQKGEGRKVKSPEVGDALYAWYIYIRGILKARLPISIFREQAKAFYQEWLQTQDPIQDSEKLKFTNPWIFT